MPMPMQISKTAAMAMALAALATGCGSDDESTAPSAAANTATTAAVSAVSELAGAYRRTMTAADLTRTEGVRDEAGPGQERPEPGPVTLTLSDGTLKFVDLGADLTIRHDFSATSDGAFRIGAYQQPEQGAFCGPDVSQTASYTWKVSGDVLTLKADQDPCADRDAGLTGTWRRR